MPVGLGRPQFQTKNFNIFQEISSIFEKNIVLWASKTYHTTNLLPYSPNLRLEKDKLMTESFTTALQKDQPNSTNNWYFLKKSNNFNCLLLAIFKIYFFTPTTFLQASIYVLIIYVSSFILFVFVYLWHYDCVYSVNIWNECVLKDFSTHFFTFTFTDQTTQSQNLESETQYLKVQN